MSKFTALCYPMDDQPDMDMICVEAKNASHAIAVTQMDIAEKYELEDCGGVTVIAILEGDCKVLAWDSKGVKP